MTGRAAATAAIIGLMWGLMWAAPVAAQGTNHRALAEVGGGYASFVDDSPIPHSVVQGSARRYITPRLAIGPEFTYMRGPGTDRDWFLTGNLTVDLLSSARPARVRPYVVAGAGIAHMVTAVGTGPFASNEGTFTAGAGARIPAAGRWYIAPEFRLGWELHWRANVTVGRTF